MTDELSSLIAAYRAENPGTALDARAVRERVLAATWRRRRGRLRRAVWLVPIAAVLVGTGALAASAPARESVSRVLTQLGFVSPAVSAPPAARHAVSRRAHAATLAASPPAETRGAAAATLDPPNIAVAATLDPPNIAVTASVEAPSAPLTAAISPDPMLAVLAPARAGTPTARGASHPRHSALDASRASAADVLATTADSTSTAPARAVDPASEASPNASPAPDQGGMSAPARAASAALAADIATYRAAHELHFVRSDYARALAAWDSYLARFPHGTFTPEARLNRAVCLARLGKTSEAETILRALAAGGDPDTSSRAERLLGAVPGN
jgi:hypothetical protein